LDEARFGIQKIIKIFGSDISRTALVKAEASGNIPLASRRETGSLKRRVWGIEDLPQIGEQYGFLKRLERPVALAVFTTKGGVLKTTITLNIARMAALHNIRTCVVGLDMQGDVTTALGFNTDLEESDDLQSAITRLNRTRGLLNVFKGEASLEDVVLPTDIPTLSFIPETPELVALDQLISSKNRREYWLKEHVIDPLKQKFDLVIMDCSPNWNRLITNALVACDSLISPLECKINNFRNYQAFRAFLEEFRKELKLEFDFIFIPTRFTSTRKLSAEIRSWYLTHVPNCVTGSIRESVHGEESVAQHISVPEYVPGSLAADEMREAILEIWNRLLETSKRQRLTKGTRLTAARTENQKEAAL
jgi:chromosome partitioning protein